MLTFLGPSVFRRSVLDCITEQSTKQTSEMVKEDSLSNSLHGSITSQYGELVGKALQVYSAIVSFQKLN